MNDKKQKVESRQYYETLAAEYRYSASYSARPWNSYFHLQRRIASIIREIEKAAVRGKIARALDVGCGDGILLPALSKTAETVLATDISSERLEQAKRTNENLKNVEFERLDVMSADSRYDSRFDLITCSEVIEHVVDTAFFFDRLFKMLAPGGTLVLSTPSKWSVREKALRLQQIILNFYFNKIKKADKSKYIFFHIGLMSVSELENLVGRYDENFQTYTVGFYVPVLTESVFTVFGNTEFYAALDEKIGASFLSWLNWTQILVAGKKPAK